jgi:PAS domain S-box-containing protein
MNNLLPNTIRILLVDDDEDDFILTQDLLDRSGDNYELEWGKDKLTFEESVKQHKHDLYLVDYRLGAVTGIDLIKWAIGEGCDKPIIILTGKGDESIDREAMRNGAYDYLVKDRIDSQSLERAVRYAMERWRTTRALKVSEERYRGIFENTKDAIYITRSDGSFVTFNESIVNMFGYTPEELSRLKMPDLYVNREERDALIEKVMTNNHVTDQEVTLKNKNGDVMHCLISVSVLYDDGGGPRYQGLIHDITLRKQHEQEHLHNEKLELSGRIARMIAHEIRNPLTNIDLSLAQLLDEIPSHIEVGLYSDIIKRNSNRINELITDLLQSSKPNLQHKTRVDLHEVVDATLQRALDRIRLKNIQLIKDVTADPCVVEGDPNYLQIALLNIIINAIEAMPDKEGKLHIDMHISNNQVMISIGDNGSGIKPEHLNKLFDPYFSNKNNGLGLGLTSTNSIITSLNGHIKVNSIWGKGTTFVITLKAV